MLKSLKIIFKCCGAFAIQKEIITYWNKGDTIKNW